MCVCVCALNNCLGFICVYSNKIGFTLKWKLFFKNPDENLKNKRALTDTRAAPGGSV